MADGSGQLLAAVGCRSEPSPNGQVFVWTGKEHRWKDTMMLRYACVFQTTAELPTHL